ncbi:hypothetical protein pb186bvf_016049 [Paramecium bursaria]
MIKLVPIICSCPLNCGCADKNKIKNWKHATCQTQAYFNHNAEVTCSGGCNPYLLQNLGFNCERTETYEKTNEEKKTATQFLVNITLAMQASEQSLQDDELVNFTTSLHINYVKRCFR